MTKESAKMLHETRAKGFTLVEILVVVGIAIMLTAFLFPAFARVRENSRRTVCQSNLKQIALAMQQYVQDHDGRYTSGLRWVTDNTGSSYNAGSTWREDVLPYIKNSQVFACPTYNRQRYSLSDPLFKEDYAYNAGRLNIILPQLTTPPKGKGESELPNTATIWMFTDWDFTGEEYIQGLTPSCGGYNHFDIRHSGGANYAFLDGHVKWFKPERMAEMECSNGPTP